MNYLRLKAEVVHDPKALKELAKLGPAGGEKMNMAKAHGSKVDGTPITDEMVEAMADEAELGYDLEHILRRSTVVAHRWGPVRLRSSRRDSTPSSSATCCYEPPRST